jgi:hypothetical protein
MDSGAKQTAAICPSGKSNMLKIKDASSVTPAQRRPLSANGDSAGDVSALVALSY